MPPPMSEIEFLRAYLAERDAPCPGCGYCLRGLTGNRCPECNQALRLQVGLVEPRAAAFIASVIGLSSSLGFCTICVAFLVIFLLWHPAGAGVPGLRDMAPLITGNATCVTGLVVLIRKRRALRELETPWRWTVVALIWLVALAFPVWFALAAP
jgi:hypothetical protein